MMYPGGVKNHIHASAGKNQPKPKTNPVVNRWRALDAVSSSEVNIARPTNAKGHQPHGGIDEATSNPAINVRAKRRRLLFFDLTQILCAGSRQKRRFVVLSNAVGDKRTESMLPNLID